MKKYQLLLAASVLALGITGCSQDEMQSGTDNSAKKEITFVSGDGVTTSTRTSCSPVYTDGSGIADFNFYWESSDHIWVNGSTKSNEPVINTGNNNLATFTVTDSPDPTYIAYTGNGSTSGTSVTIPTTQTQAAYTPVRTATAHLGTDGDCGVATATKTADNTYKFTLSHKASYLMLLPRITGTTYSGYSLTSIQVTADQPIAGTYTLDKTNGLTSGTNTSKTITLNTGGTTGFPLVTDRTQVYANTASYLAIAPTASKTTFDFIYTITKGNDTKHILSTGLSLDKCEADKMYYLTDNLNYSENKEVYKVTYDINKGQSGTVPTDANSYTSSNNTVIVLAGTNLVGPVGKVNFKCWNTKADGSGTNYTTNQTFTISGDVTLYAQWSATKYAQGYTMWDAKAQYPVGLSSYTSSTCGNSWYNTASPEKATNDCAGCPTKVQALMYINAGVYWGDGPIGYSFTAPDGTVVTQGLWIKKKEYISGFDTNSAKQDVTSVGTGDWSKYTGDKSQFFFLPAAGYYDNGTLSNAGTNGHYWSSTPLGTYAWHLGFGNGGADVYSLDRGVGFCLWAAQ